MVPPCFSPICQPGIAIRFSIVLFTAIAVTPAAATIRSGAAVYAEECASCHEATTPRTPIRAMLAARPARAIVQALESGVMRVIGTFRLNGPERVAVAEYLSGETYSVTWNTQRSDTCSAAGWSDASALQSPSWNGWGNGPDNTRFQNHDDAGLEPGDVAALTLAWAFAFPGETIVEAQPTVVGGRLFIGSRSGMVYALDAKTGCVHWTFQADGPVKSSVLIAPVSTTDGAPLGAYFGDLGGMSYGLDAASGRELWRVRAEPHPTARIMGSPQYADGQLLMPLTSVESYLAGELTRECCTFRGSVVALNPATGAINWQRHTVDEPGVTGRNSKGVAMYGPSGATVWSAPTYDDKTRTVYVGTGENYSHPATSTSDAILAIDLDTRDTRWAYQGLAGDAWNMSCGTADPFNCPTDNGPDYDFGSSPILVTLKDGRRILIGAQKSGVVHALDPDAAGKLLWQRQIANGGVLGGIEWGPATDGTRLYVAIADMRWNTTDLLAPELALDPQAGGGLVALDLADGKIAWQAPGIDCGSRPHCSPAQTAAVTAIPGVVFAGSVSGELRAFAADTGAVLWSFDTAREFDTVNGASGRGGALDATGPVVVGGFVYVSSGYSKWGGLPGNVLLAFRPKR